MAKTGRLLISHEAPVTGGFAAEISSAVQVRRIPDQLQITYMLLGQMASDQVNVRDYTEFNIKAYICYTVQMFTVTVLLSSCGKVFASASVSGLNEQ